MKTLTNRIQDTGLYVAQYHAANHTIPFKTSELPVTVNAQSKHKAYTVLEFRILESRVKIPLETWVCVHDFVCSRLFPGVGRHFAMDRSLMQEVVSVP